MQTQKLKSNKFCQHSVSHNTHTHMYTHAYIHTHAYTQPNTRRVTPMHDTSEHLAKRVCQTRMSKNSMGKDAATTRMLLRLVAMTIMQTPHHTSLIPPSPPPHARTSGVVPDQPSWDRSTMWARRQGATHCSFGSNLSLWSLLPWTWKWRSFRLLKFVTRHSSHIIRFAACFTFHHCTLFENTDFFLDIESTPYLCILHVMTGTRRHS